MKYDVDYIFRALHVNISANIVSVGKMKRLIKSNKIFMVMVVREKNWKHLKLFRVVIPLTKNM